jgi:peptidoglycan/LPS O-acetylase OafA/YrhL
MIFAANIARPVAVAMHQNGEQIWMNTFAHLDTIAAGILLALLRDGKILSLNSNRTRVALMAFGLGCLATIAYFGFQDRRISPTGTLIGRPFVPLACAAILVSFLELPIRSSALQYLGKISYGLYVYHLGALAIVDRLLPGGDAGAIHAGVRLAFTLAITIAISFVSYRIVETPFLNLKRRFTFVSSRPV